MSYDSWLEPPDPVFGTCIFCKCSEEDHVIVDIDEGSRFPTTYTVCPAAADVAEAIEADYPFELVFAGVTDNALTIAYEDAMADVADNAYDGDDGR